MRNRHKSMVDLYFNSNRSNREHEGDAEIIDIERGEMTMCRIIWPALQYSFLRTLINA